MRRLSDYLGTNPASSQYDELNANNMLQDLFKEKPALKKFQDPLSTKAIFSDALAGGGRQLEYWPKNEPGTLDNPHPSPGDTLLQIFNPQLKRNPDLLKRAMFGDLLHGMRSDPQLNDYISEFSQNFTPQSLERENRRGGLRGPTIDAYIRGYLAPDENDEFRKAQARFGTVYSPKQLDLLETIKSYLEQK